jgi:hypothetical protein
MRRALVQFDPETYQQLRQRAFREQRSISSLVRQLVAAGLGSGAKRARPTQVDQFQSVRSGRTKQGRLSPLSERHDEALAKAFEA